MSRAALFLVLGLLAVSISTTAEEALPVLEEAPDAAIELGQVSANSRGFSGRTDSGKEKYVIRELRRQAAGLGGNAMVIDSMQRFERPEPRYGRLPGQMQYEKVSEFRGRATVLRVPEGAATPVSETQDKQ